MSSFFTSMAITQSITAINYNHHNSNHIYSWQEMHTSSAMNRISCFLSTAWTYQNIKVKVSSIEIMRIIRKAINNSNLFKVCWRRRYNTTSTHDWLCNECCNLHARGLVKDVYTPKKEHKDQTSTWETNKRSWLVIPKPTSLE